MNAKITWADIIDEYDAIDSYNMIENIYKIIDLPIKKKDILYDENDIHNNAKESEHQNMIFD
jgi:hypothetical protein